MSGFRGLCFKKTMGNVIYYLKVPVLTNTWTKIFRLKIVIVITQMSNGSPEIYVSTHQI